MTASAKPATAMTMPTVAKMNQAASLTIRSSVRSVSWDGRGGLSARVHAANKRAKASRNGCAPSGSLASEPPFPCFILASPLCTALSGDTPNYMFVIRCGSWLDLHPPRVRSLTVPRTAIVRQGVRPERRPELPPRNANASSFRNLELVPPLADLGECLRRERRERGWTQSQLADYCHVRTQTVSAWERGHAPQRRFYARIADFLNLKTVQEVEALLHDNRGSGAETVPASPQQPSPTRTEYQGLVLDAVVRQLKTGRKPSPELTQLFRDLLTAVGLPTAPALAEPEPD
jgi:transcriptional regulator with XRE-family HTH domain